MADEQEEVVPTKDSTIPEKSSETVGNEAPKESEEHSEELSEVAKEPESTPEKEPTPKSEEKEVKSADSTFSVEDLLKKLDIAKREVQEMKQKVAAANKKKEAAFRKKQELSKQIGEKIGELLGSKKRRNALTSDVRELKKERDRLNKEIRKRVQEIKAFNEANKDLLGRLNRKKNPAFLQKQIEGLEFKLETQPMSFDAERKLRKKLKDLQKEYDEVKDKAGALGDLREKSKEIDALKKEANKLHREVQERAKASQSRHEELVGESKEVDDLKKEEETLYQAFLEEKEKYTKINVKLKEKIADLQRIKEELNKRDVKLKEDRKQEELKTLQERAKDAEEKVKKKQKLTTEDLLAMQGFKK